jgi:hypothetical protein
VNFSAGAANKILFTTTAQTLTAGTVSSIYTFQVQDTFGNAVSTTATVNLSSTSTGTVTFSATSGGASVTSVSLTATSTASFYYKDTKAGTPTITAAATGITSGTQAATVNPAAPVSGVTITTTQITDTTQPTGQSSVQAASGSAGSLNIITLPYTSSSSTDYQIVADGSSRGKVTVTVQDTYGNLRSGDTVALSGSGLDNLVFSATSTTSTASGTATFDVSSTDIGTANIQVTVGGSNYGNTFTVLFKSDDRTPPTINLQSNALSLTSGDLISASEGVTISAIFSDSGSDATDTVDFDSIKVVLKDSSGDTWDCVKTGNTQCQAGALCTMKWTPSSTSNSGKTLTPGRYQLVMTVEDDNANVQTVETIVMVSGSSQLQSIAAGPDDGSGVFNPLNGGNIVISFQSPFSIGTVVLEVYRRDGRMVYTFTQPITKEGYNEILWNGRSLSGGHIANGVYVFRLRAMYANGGTSEQTGKLAIFKK